MGINKFDWNKRLVFEHLAATGNNMSSDIIMSEDDFIDLINAHGSATEEWNGDIDRDGGLSGIQSSRDPLTQGHIGGMHEDSGVDLQFNKGDMIRYLKDRGAPVTEHFIIDNNLFAYYCSIYNIDYPTDDPRWEIKTRWDRVDMTHVVVYTPNNNNEEITIKPVTWTNGQPSWN